MNRALITVGLGCGTHLLLRVSTMGGEPSQKSYSWIERAPDAFRIRKKIELFEGQHNGVNGIDLIGVAPNGRVKVIEFSTGAKPAATEQMSWTWIDTNFEEISARYESGLEN